MGDDRYLCEERRYHTQHAPAGDGGDLHQVDRGYWESEAQANTTTEPAHYDQGGWGGYGDTEEAHQVGQGHHVESWTCFF